MRILKFTSIVMLLFLATNVTFAGNNMYDQQIKYYNSMKTCTKGTFPLGGTSLKMSNKSFGIGMIYYIYGFQNNKCHIRERLGNYDKHCYLPMDVARKYAEEGINTLNASVKNGSAYSKYINEINNDEKYCSSDN